jgi:transposase
MTESGRIVKHCRFDNSIENLAEFLGEHSDKDSRAVLEAGYNSLVMYDWLDSLVGQVKLAHPRKVKVIAEAKIKTDKIDSRLLAHLLRCNLIPQAHASSFEARESRRLLRSRIFLVKIATMTKNRIHSLIDGYPSIREQRYMQNMFTLVGIKWLKQIKLPSYSRKVLDNDLYILEQINLTLKTTEKWISRHAGRDTRIKNLQTIPGIGRFFSLLILSEIDDISRFRKPARLHAYAGLVPTVHSSGGREYHGRLNTECNKYLRFAMIEAVVPAIRKDYNINRYYNKLKMRKGPNSAKVATARRLLTIVYRVLKENRQYRVVD